MSAPIFYFCTPLRLKRTTVYASQKINIKILKATMAFDAVAITTLLVIGILGALSMIALPTAASYAMIGTAAAGVLGLIAMFTSMCMLQKGHKQ